MRNVINHHRTPRNFTTCDKGSDVPYRHAVLKCGNGSELRRVQSIGVSTSNDPGSFLNSKDHLSSGP